MVSCPSDITEHSEKIQLDNRKAGANISSACKLACCFCKNNMKLETGYIERDLCVVRELLNITIKHTNDVEDGDN